ncbi:MAG: hypothetical protein MI802_15740 [Desulfobacterales bacterium]|nr:hypothetical protein [Desulfobacterales bacterium]
MLWLHYNKIAGLLMLVLILLCAAATPVHAWDTTVYARNCNPQSNGNGYHLYTFSGNDGLCGKSSGSGTKYISFLETGSYNCNSNETGNCKMAKTAHNEWSCSKAATIRANSTLLIYGDSGNTLTASTFNAPSVNCCVMIPGVTGNECATYFRECRASGISGPACLSMYVPCREAGGTVSACAGNS